MNFGSEHWTRTGVHWKNYGQWANFSCNWNSNFWTHVPLETRRSKKRNTFIIQIYFLEQLLSRISLKNRHTAIRAIYYLLRLEIISRSLIDKIGVRSNESRKFERNSKLCMVTLLKKKKGKENVRNKDRSLQTEEKRLKIKIAEMAIQEVQLRIKALSEDMRRTEELHRLHLVRAAAGDASVRVGEFPNNSWKEKKKRARKDDGGEEGGHAFTCASNYFY